MGDRHVTSDESEKIFNTDANILYGWAMSQSLPWEEIEFDKKGFEDILNTPDYSVIGYFVEVGLKYPDKIKEKTKLLPFCSEN